MLRSNRAKRFLRAACLTAAAVLVGVGQAHAILIDSFDVTFQQITNGDPNNAAQEVVTAPEAIGGTRDVRLEIQSNPFFSPGDPTSPTMTVTINPASSGLALYSEDAGVNGRLILTYDGNLTPGLQFPGFAPVDFLSSGNGILLRANSDRDFTARFILYSGSGEASEQELLIAGDANESQAEFFFPYTGFTGNADLSAVTAVQLVIDGLLGRTDIDLDNVESGFGGPAAIIPEPGSLALLGMGALGMMGFGLRRRRQTS